MPNKTNQPNKTNTGLITQIVSVVVDVKFEGRVPEIHHALTVTDPKGTEVVLEVALDLGDGVVRTIAMGTTDGLKRGM